MVWDHTIVLYTIIISMAYQSNCLFLAKWIRAVHDQVLFAFGRFLVPKNVEDCIRKMIFDVII